MKKIAKFSKVSFDQFLKDWIDTFPYFEYEEQENIDMLREVYDNIKLPTRSTKYSAGYDFCTTTSVDLLPGQSIKIPTGIRCEITDNYVLKIYPRSSLGFKYRMTLNNTVGIIDSDYFYANNEGHIMVKITNNGYEPLTLNAYDRFVQGIFLEYGITVDDEADGDRVGGFGSTGTK